MTFNEEPSSKPREMVHKAQAEAINWMHQYRRAFQGLANEQEIERLQSELHAAVMLYWEQIARFAGRKEVRELWNQEPMFGDVTLEDLRQYRLAANTTTESEYDPDVGAEEPVNIEEPWQLEPRQAVAVLDQLNKCANRLGFDASPSDSRDRFNIASSENGDHPEPHNDNVKQPQ